MNSTRLKTFLITAVTLLTLGALVATAPGAMRSKKIGPGLCKTTGGGAFVPIPGFPGERIDRRLLPDIKYLVDRYKIFITDGLSSDPVHAAGGEHPIGLATDIVPDTSKGGSWKLVTALAKFAEPVQDQPVAPFRWVGYNGDAGHGRGNHLHLSWNHTDAKPGHPAKTVYTMNCPGSASSGGGKNGGGKDNGGGKNGGSGGGKNGGNGGGLHPGHGGGNGDGGGGLQPRVLERFGALAADPVIETGGEGLP